MAVVALRPTPDFLSRTHEEIRKTFEEEFEASQAQIKNEVQALLSTVLQELTAQFVRLELISEQRLQESRKSLSEQLLIERANFSAEADSLRKACRELQETVNQRNLDLDALTEQHEAASQALEAHQQEHLELQAELDAFRQKGGEESARQLSRIAQLTQQNSDLAQHAAEAEVRMESELVALRRERDELRSNLPEMHDRSKAAQEHVNPCTATAHDLRPPGRTGESTTSPQQSPSSGILEQTLSGDSLPTVPELSEGGKGFLSLSNFETSGHGDRLPPMPELPENFTPLSEPEESICGGQSPAPSEARPHHESTEIASGSDTLPEARQSPRGQSPAPSEARPHPDGAEIASGSDTLPEARQSPRGQSLAPSNTQPHPTIVEIASGSDHLSEAQQLPRAQSPTSSNAQPHPAIVEIASGSDTLTEARQPPRGQSPALADEQPHPENAEVALPSGPSLEARPPSRGIRRTSPEPRRSSRQGAWFWKTEMPPSSSIGHLRYESLLLHSEPSSDSPIVGSVLLEKFFKAKPLARDQNWLEVSLSGTTSYLLRQDPSSESEDDLRSALARPADGIQDLSHEGAIQEFAFTALGADALLKMIRRDRDPFSDVNVDDPSSSARDEYFFWRVGSRQNAKVATYAEVPSAKTPWVKTAEKSTSLVQSGSIVLGRLYGDDWVQLSEVYGQRALYMRRSGPSGENLERLVDPFDILGPSSPFALGNPLEVYGAGSCLQDPRPLENAIGRKAFGASQERISDLGKAAVKAAAIEALSKHLGRTPKEVVVGQELEGRGRQHRTFGVDADLAKPGPALRFILRCDQPISRDLAAKWRLPPSVNQARFVAANRAIAAAGLGPEWFGSGPGWYLERHGGKSLSKGSIKPEELGKLLAKLHKVDVAWFDETLTFFREFLPWAKDLPRGSHVWWFACERDYFVGLDEKDLRDWAHRPEYKPESAPAKRIVTNSGDFFHANVVRDASGQLKIIDNERSCVTYAGQDLYISCELCFAQATQKLERRRFLKAYLMEMGDLRRDLSTPEHERELIDEVLQDIEVFRRAHQHFQGITQMQQRPAQASPRPSGQNAITVPIEAGADAITVPRARLRSRPGRLGMWRPRLLPGRVLEEPEVQCLKLLPSMSDTRFASGLVPLEQAVLAREVGDGHEWLEVCVSPTLYVHKARSGISWEPLAEDALQSLMSQPEQIYDISMRPKASAAILMLFYELEKAPPGERMRWQEQLLDGTCWWRARMKMLVRARPHQSSTGIAVLRKGQLVLGTPMGNGAWVEISPISFGPAPRGYALVHDPKLGSLLERVQSAAEVLTSWEQVFDSRKSLGVGVDDGADLVVEEAIRIGSSALSRTRRPNGTLTVLEMNGDSKYHRTFQLQRSGALGPAATHVLRHDRLSSQNGLPLVIHKERFALARELLADLHLGPKQLWEGPRWHIEEWLGGSDKVHFLDVARLLAKIHSTSRTEWFEDHRELCCRFFPFLSDAAKGSHVWAAMTDTETFGHLHRMTPAEKREWSRWTFKCRSPASEEIVTVHGDPHQGNLKYSNAVLKAFDFEHCIVTWAVEDLAVAVHSIQSYELRRRFVEEYLQGVGRTPTKELVDDTIFDARCYRLAEKKLKRPPGESVEKLEAVWKIARSESTLRAQELRERIMATSLTEATQWWRGQS